MIKKILIFILCIILLSSSCFASEASTSLGGTSDTSVSVWTDKDLVADLSYSVLDTNLLERQTFNLYYDILCIIPSSIDYSESVYDEFVLYNREIIESQDFSSKLQVFSYPANDDGFSSGYDSSRAYISEIKECYLSSSGFYFNFKFAENSSSNRYSSSNSIILRFTVCVPNVNSFLFNSSETLDSYAYLYNTSQPSFSFAFKYPDNHTCTEIIQMDSAYTLCGITVKKTSDFYDVARGNRGVFSISNNLFSYYGFYNDSFLKNPTVTYSISSGDNSYSYSETVTLPYNGETNTVVGINLNSIYSYEFDSVSLSVPVTTDSIIANNTFIGSGIGTNVYFAERFKIQTSVYNFSQGDSFSPNSSTILNGSNGFFDYSSYYEEPSSWYDIPTYLYNFIIFLCFEMPLTSEIMSPLGAFVITFKDIWQKIVFPFLGACGIFGIVLMFIVIYSIIKRYVIGGSE